MKQPLVTVAVVYGAGIVLGYFLEPLLFPALAVAFVVAVTALVVCNLRALLLPVVLFVFGWVNMGSRTAVISPWDLQTMWQAGEAIVDIRATVASAPVQRNFLRNGVEITHTLTELDVTAVGAAHGSWEPAFGRVVATTPGIIPAQIRVGQFIEINGIARKPSTPLAPGMFDYRRHLQSRGIHYELKVDSPRAWTISIVSTPTSLGERFRNWAQRTLARGLPEQDEALRLQWAMLLGWKTALTAEVSEPFMRSGTMHIFAISGLHIALIAGICLALLRASALPRIACGLIVVPLIWFYTSATGWQASAIRATIMMTVIILGWALHRPADLVNSLATAACLILVWQPQQLFQAGFQLSFFVVLSIALLSPIIESLKKRIFPLDPLLPDQLRPWWQPIAIKAGNFVWTSCAVSLAAFIGSMPLIAHYFHLFTPGSLVANLLIVPVSSLALMSGIGALITGDLVPFLTEWFNHSGWFWMRVMIWLSKTAAGLPAAWWHVSPPGPFVFGVYYGLLVAACAGWFGRPILRWLIAICASAILLLHIFQRLEERTWHRITVLPLNNSHAVYVEPARGGREWLFNCGDHGGVEFSVKPFLQSKGTDRLAHLVLTHGDARYMGGALLLQELFPVRQVHTSPTSFRSPRYREVLRKFKQDSLLETSLTNGFATAPWIILHPNSSDRFATPKDNAIVALATFDGVRVLILPPLGRAAQNAIHTRHPTLSADIIIAGWAEDSEIAAEWLDQLRPKLLLVANFKSTLQPPASTGKPPKQGHSTIYIGRETGAVTISMRNGAWRTQNTRPVSELEPGRETISPNVQGERAFEIGESVVETTTP